MGNEGGLSQIGRGYNEGGNLLSFTRFRKTDHSDISHPLMFCYHGFDFGWIHIGAAADNKVGGTC